MNLFFFYNGFVRHMSFVMKDLNTLHGLKCYIIFPPAAVSQPHQQTPLPRVRWFYQCIPAQTKGKPGPERGRAGGRVAPPAPSPRQPTMPPDRTEPAAQGDGQTQTCCWQLGSPDHRLQSVQNLSNPPSFHNFNKFDTSVVINFTPNSEGISPLVDESHCMTGSKGEFGRSLACPFLSVSNSKA